MPGPRPLPAALPAARARRLPAPRAPAPGRPGKSRDRARGLGGAGRRGVGSGLLLLLLLLWWALAFGLGRIRRQRGWAMGGQRACEAERGEARLRLPSALARRSLRAARSFSRTRSSQGARCQPAVRATSAPAWRRWRQLPWPARWQWCATDAGALLCLGPTRDMPPWREGLAAGPPLSVAQLT